MLHTKEAQAYFEGYKEGVNANYKMKQGAASEADFATLYIISRYSSHRLPQHHVHCRDRNCFRS